MLQAGRKTGVAASAARQNWEFLHEIAGHSSRSAAAGSMRSARASGGSCAHIVMTKSVAATENNVHGSVALTSKRKGSRRRVATTAIAVPTPRPKATTAALL